MAHAACKWILNQGVRTAAEATNVLVKEQIDGIARHFEEDAIESMIDLDLAYMTAKHLIQNGDKRVFALAARFSADVAHRASQAAIDRAAEFEEE